MGCKKCDHTGLIRIERYGQQFSAPCECQPVRTPKTDHLVEIFDRKNLEVVAIEDVTDDDVLAYAHRFKAVPRQLLPQTAIQEVTCSYCGALPRTPCIGDKGPRKSSHLERVFERIKLTIIENPPLKVQMRKWAFVRKDSEAEQ